MLLLQLQYNYDQCDKGQKKLRDAMNLLIDEKGICQMRDVMIKFGTPMGGAECPRCKGKEFEMHHEAGSTGFKECWIQTCAACGHEMNHEIFRP